MRFDRRHRQQVGERLRHLGEVGTGEGGNDAIERPGPVDRDVPDPGVGDRTAQDGHVLGVGQVHVGQVRRLAGEEPGVLDALHAGADALAYDDRDGFLDLRHH